MVGFGFVKIATLLLYVLILALVICVADNYRISIAGLVVLGGHTRVENPQINWSNPWRGNTQASAYGATNAMVKLIFSYAGYQNSFALVNEIKVCIRIPPI